MSEQFLEPFLEPPEAPVATPWDIVRAARVELGVTDLAASRRFYVDALGFLVTEEGSDAIYLRGYEEAVHHSLCLRRSDEPKVLALGFRVGAEGDLAHLESYFREAGCETHRAGPAEASSGIGEALRVRDRLGFPLEFFFAMDPAERLLQRFDLHRGSRVMRIDHLNIHVNDPDDGRRMWRELGFRTTEVIAEDPPAKRSFGVWMTRKPFVHDLALTAGAGPRLHHVGFTCAGEAAIFSLCDQLGARRMEGAIERGPGRHGVSNACYLYLRDPDGHRIEFYVGDYYTGDPDHRALRWSVHDPRRRSYWGHAVAESWYRESSLLAADDGGVVPVRTLDAESEAVAEKVVVG